MDATPPDAAASDLPVGEAAQLALLPVRIDPSQPARAVDHLLCAAGGQPLEAVQRWSVARRLNALVALRLAQGDAMESVTLRCPGCGATFAVAFDLQACLAPVCEDVVRFDTALGPRLASLPTGAQQVRWQQQEANLQAVGAELMQLDLPPDDATLDALGEALAERDPLRALPLAADCPDCAAPVHQALDLEVHLVEGFARAQRTLLSDIATLATAFGWPEREIAALPAWRRAWYLQHLEGAR